MTKFSLIAFASAASLALAACGGSDDASEDAMADTVEMPADEAMASAPEPAADTDVVADAADDAAAGAGEEAEATTAEVAEAAEAAAADAAAAAEAATQDAEEGM
jgi:hypothetical protein